MILMGLAVSVRPYMLLDVVLSPQELANHKIADATLALLKRGSAGDAAMWVGLGIFFFVASVVGLSLTPISKQTESTGPSSVPG